MAGGHPVRPNRESVSVWMSPKRRLPRRREEDERLPWKQRTVGFAAELLVHEDVEHVAVGRAPIPVHPAPPEPAREGNPPLRAAGFRVGRRVLLDVDGQVLVEPPEIAV